MTEVKEPAYKKDEIPAVVVPATGASGDFDFAAIALEQSKGRRVTIL